MSALTTGCAAASWGRLQRLDAPPREWLVGAGQVAFDRDALIVTNQQTPLPAAFRGQRLIVISLPGSCSRPLAAATASGERCGIWPSRSRAACSGSSVSSVTRFQALACSPEKTSAVMTRRLARSIGINSRRVIMPLMSGIRPHLASIRENSASARAKRKSAPSAS